MNELEKSFEEEELNSVYPETLNEPLKAALAEPDPSVPFSNQPQTVRPYKTAPRRVDIPRSLTSQLVSQFPEELKTEIPKQEPIEQYGAIEGITKSAVTSFKRYGLLSGALTYGLEKQPSLMNGNYVDHEFSATSDDLVPSYQAINPKYWPILLGKQNQAAWDYSYQRILKEQEEEKESEKTKWWQHAVGGLGGGVAAFGLDVAASWGLINPVTRVVAPTLAKTIARNAIEGAAEFGLYESAVQLGQYSARETMEFQEALTNVALASTLGALTAGAGSLFRQSNLTEFKSLLSKQSEGVEIKYNLDKKGNVVGFAAVDDSAGAMKVTNYDYKDFAISGFTGEGQDFKFYMNPVKPIFNGVTKFVGKWGGNPIVQGLLSQSASMKSFTARMMRPNFEIDAVTLNGKKRPQALDEIIKARTAQVSEFEGIFIEGWFKHLGIDTEGKSYVNLKAQDFMAKAKQGINNEQFKEEVSRAVSRNGVSEVPAAQWVASEWIKRMEKIDEEIKQFVDLPQEVFGADRHFARDFDVEWMWQNPNEAIENIFNGFKKTQEEIVEKLAPITRKQSEVALLKARQEAEKNINIKQQLLKKLTQEEQALKELEEQIHKSIFAEKGSKRWTVGKGDARKVRSIVEEGELKLNAQKTYNRMLGLSQEQMDEVITGGAKGAGTGKNAFLEERVLMFTDEELHNYKLMEKDPVKRINAYMRRAIKFIEGEKFFKEQGYVEGKQSKLDFMTSRIEDDYDTIRNQKIEHYKALKEGKSGAELEKIKLKEKKYFDGLYKDQVNDVQVAREIYGRVLGAVDLKNSRANRFFNVTSKWMDFSFLNAIASLQLGEFIAPAFTKGWKAHVNHALVPFIKDVFTPLTKGNAAARQNARNFGLAIQFMSSYFSHHWDVNTGRIPKGWKIPFTDVSFESYLDKGGRIIRSMNLSDPIANMTETIAVMGTQAAIIQSLRRAANGKITKARKRFINQLGIDYDAMGKRILAQHEKFGKEENGVFGRYFSNTHLWDDLEAKNVFSTAVHADVRATQFFGSDTTSWPTWAGDPRGPSRFLFKYMGYSFSAMSNYLLPVMQSLGRGDFERVSAAAALVAINALVDPMRKLARGEEPDLSPGSLLSSGLINSGMGGILVDTALRANNALRLFDMSSGDRFKYSRGLINTAPETMLVDLAKVIGMGLTANPNKADIQRAVKLFFPFADIMPLRPLEYELLDKLDLPKRNKEFVFGD